MVAATPTAPLVTTRKLFGRRLQESDVCSMDGGFFSLWYMCVYRTYSLIDSMQPQKFTAQAAGPTSTAATMGRRKLLYFCLYEWD